MKSSNSILKLLTLLFAVVLFIGLISIPLHLYAASDVQLTVSNVSGKAGDEVTVSINISPNSKLGAAGIKLKYDTSKLELKTDSEFKGYKIGAAASGGMSSVNPDFRPTEGNFKTIFDGIVHTTGITEGGSLLDITFKIKSGWSGTTPLVLTTDDFIDPVDYKDIPHKISNGSVTIGTPATTVVTNTSTSTATTNSGVTTTARPTTTRIQQVTDKDGANVTETDKDGSTVNKTTVIYETVARTEFVTEKDGSKVTEKDAAGSTAYKTTVVYEKVVGTEYVTGEDGSKVFVTDESGSTVYATSLVYETVDSEDLQGETGTENTSDNGVMGALSTAKKTAIIIAFVGILLVAAVLIAYKRKKDSAK